MFFKSGKFGGKSGKIHSFPCSNFSIADTAKNLPVILTALFSHDPHIGPRSFPAQEFVEHSFDFSFRLWYTASNYFGKIGVLPAPCLGSSITMGNLTAKQQRIYDFIQAFTAQHGYPPSVREIGAAVGLKSPSTVHFHLKGLEDAGMIIKAEGKTRAITLASPPRPAVAEEADPHANQIPILGNVAAGAPILAVECIEDYLTFDTQGSSGEHFALKVRGESMLGAGILPGDLVVVHRQPDAYNGEIVVALFEDEATVKTLRRKDGKTWLMPANDAYEPIDGTRAQIIGKVVAVVRRY